MFWAKGILEGEQVDDWRDEGRISSRLVLFVSCLTNIPLNLAVDCVGKALLTLSPILL